MSEQTKTETETYVDVQTLQDLKHAVLIFSVTANLAVFIVWILALA